MDMAIDQFLSIAQAAENFGVSRQRMHQLIETYGVEVETLTSRMKLVNKQELQRIPANRPSGVRLDRKKKSKKSRQRG